MNICCNFSVYFRADERLAMTGSVWEACEQLGTLPKDNLQAVNKKLQKDELLVMDALQEVEEVTFNKTETYIRLQFCI
jgi:Grap2 and cyclin-D-interacting